MKYLFLFTTLIALIAVLLVAAFTKFSLTNEGYDRLKAVVTKWDYIVIFVALIVKTFAVPYGIETVVVVAGIGALLAGLLGIANKNYNVEKVSNLLNEDLLKDMLGFGEDLHLMGELETDDSYTEEEETESEE